LVRARDDGLFCDGENHQNGYRRLRVTGTSHIADLHVSTSVIDGRPSTLITIDGADVLLTQRPDLNAAGRRNPPERKVFVPPDPAGLPPPDSATLLPTTAPRQAMIGICDCGESGCNSLWLQVRRDAGTVIWEPERSTPRATIDTTWRFDLRRYLYALDEGQRSMGGWEQRPHRVARELRRQRDSLFGLTMVDQVTHAHVKLLDASAWPGHDYVLLTAATPLGVRQFELPVTAELTDQQISRMINVVDLDQWT
jgi:hypothetical protein